MSVPPPAISADLWESLIPIDPDEMETITETTTVTTVPTPSASSSVPAAPTQSYGGHYQTNYAHYAQPGAYEAYRQYSAQQAQQAQAQAHAQQLAQQSQFSANTSAYGSSSSSHSTMPQQSMARQAIANSHGQSQGALDTADVATLNDALGSAGVDLRAEEESLQRSNDTPAPYRPYEADRSRKQPPRPHFDVSFLGERMRAIAAQHKVLPPPPGLAASSQAPSQPSAIPSTASTSATTPLGTLPDDTINYLALALRARLQDLVTGMIAAAQHRAKVQADRRPGIYDDGRAAWGVRVRGDVGRVLGVLEKVERGEEKREREERVRRWEKGRAGKEKGEARERAVEEALGALLEGRMEEFLEAGIPEVDADADADADGGGSPTAGDGGESMDLDNADASSGRQRKKAKKAPLTEEEREEANRRMANAAASRAAGLGGPRRYAWLTTGLKSAGALAKAANAPAANPYAALTAFSRQAMDNSLGRGQDGENVPPPPPPPRVRAYPSTQMEEKTMRWAPDADTRMRVTLRDAMFVIEKERGHGGGRGAARGWS
ncbi:hypothetical protein C8F04DRAFT_1400530 [Mycena alexandri]|uniref:Transcription initiation factor TFIID subunit 4 n=1 Tax=Mycena alexandri TaxID=1745969 RepID=A0AAD6SDR0_9AGAR|nr:hypothetical protein C8F04DRAFT_1400530 [Mycena alexandri]